MIIFLAIPNMRIYIYVNLLEERLLQRRQRRDLVEKKAMGGSMAFECFQVEEAAEWRVDWAHAMAFLRRLTLSQLIRDRFGLVGLRIFNLLQEGHPPQEKLQAFRRE